MIPPNLFTTHLSIVLKYKLGSFSSVRAECVRNQYRNSKLLFGTLTREDGDRYNQYISTLFKGQTDPARIAKEDAHVVQHELASVTSELTDLKTAISKQYKLYRDMMFRFQDLCDFCFC